MVDLAGVSLNGTVAYLSICSGRQDSESAHKCVGTGLSATLIISVVLSLVCLIFCRPLVLLFGASQATFTLACDYFYILAVFFQMERLLLQEIHSQYIAILTSGQII